MSKDALNLSFIFATNKITLTIASKLKLLNKLGKIVPMQVYLVRHGKKEEKPGDPSLSPQGIVEAHLLANYFKFKNIDRIISSPSKRCIETAAAISSSLSINFSTDKRLEERLNFGDIPNQNYKEYMTEIGKSVLKRNYILANKMTSKKKGSMIEELISESHDNCLLLVTHQGAISDYLRNAFRFNTLKKYSSRYVKYFNLDSASITLIELGKKPKIVLLNSTKHLLYE